MTYVGTLLLGMLTGMIFCMGTLLIINFIYDLIERERD